MQCSATKSLCLGACYMNRASAGSHHAEQAADGRRPNPLGQQGPLGVREYLCHPAPVGCYSSGSTVSNDSYTLVVVPSTLVTEDASAQAALSTSKGNRMGWLRKLERLLLIFGVLMLVLYGA